MTLVAEPLSYCYRPKSAEGLARPLTVPKLPCGRGSTTSPSAYVAVLYTQLRDEVPFSGLRADAHQQLRGLFHELRELDGAPLWRVDEGSRTRLLRGAAALELLVPGDWRARVVVRHARKLARRPEEVLHLISTIDPVQVPHGSAETCALCGEADPLTWRGNWCCTRRARRRVGSGRICGCCVEHFEG